MTNKTSKKLILSLVAMTLLALKNPSVVYADCEPNYGGGETCVYNKNFDMDKKVRVEGDDEWRDKVVGVREGEVVEFRIRVKNTGEIEVDDMRMKDFLPSELYWVGGDNLTEEWDNFDIGETKEFIIKVRIHGSEFDRENFEKCVVNKATAYYSDVYEASDTATVCYGDAVITELPKTGANEIAFAFLGTSFMGLGSILNLKRKIS